MTHATYPLQDVRFPKTIIEPIRHMIENKPVGVSFEEALAQINRTPSEYHDSHFTLNATEYLALHRWLKHRTYKQIRMRDWLAYYSATSAGLAGLAALSANTIRDALFVPVNYMRLYVPAVNVELQERPTNTRLCLNMVVDLEELNRFLLETVVGVFNIIANQVTTEKIPRTIHFKHCCDVKGNQYTRLKEMEAYFGFHVYFDSDFNGMEGDSDWLDHKTRSPNEVTYEIAKRALDAELADLNAHQSLSASVYAELNRLGKKGYFPSLEEYASSIHLSPRTFIRRLARENSSFKAISNDVWFPLAKELLLNNKFSVKQIASKSGFKSVNSFARAFKSMTNKTPKEWQSENASNRI